MSENETLSDSGADAGRPARPAVWFVEQAQLVVRQHLGCTAFAHNDDEQCYSTILKQLDELKAQAALAVPSSAPDHEINAMISRIQGLIADIRFAPAEGGVEMNEARTRYGTFIREHGETLIDWLAAARPRSAPPETP